MTKKRKTLREALGLAPNWNIIVREGGVGENEITDQPPKKRMTGAIQHRNTIAHEPLGPKPTTIPGRPIKQDTAPSNEDLTLPDGKARRGLGAKDDVIELKIHANQQNVKGFVPITVFAEIADTLAKDSGDRTADKEQMRKLTEKISELNVYWNTLPKVE